MMCLRRRRRCAPDRAESAAAARAASQPAAWLRSLLSQRANAAHCCGHGYCRNLRTTRDAACAAPPHKSCTKSRADRPFQEIAPSPPMPSNRSQPFAAPAGIASGRLARTDSMSARTRQGPWAQRRAARPAWFLVGRALADHEDIARDRATPRSGAKRATISSAQDRGKILAETPRG